MKIGNKNLIKGKWEEKHTSQSLLKSLLQGFDVKGVCDEERESKLMIKRAHGKFLTVVTASELIRCNSFSKLLSLYNSNFLPVFLSLSV